MPVIHTKLGHVRTSRVVCREGDCGVRKGVGQGESGRMGAVIACCVCRLSAMLGAPQIAHKQLEETATRGKHYQLSTMLERQGWGAHWCP